MNHAVLKLTNALSYSDVISNTADNSVHYAENKMEMITGRKKNIIPNVLKFHAMLQPTGKWNQPSY